MRKREVFNRYNVPPAVGTVNNEPSMTQSEFAAECDINVIMARALKTGALPVRADMARYGDFSEVVDFHHAQEVILDAERKFASLPSKVRDRFKNSPAEFLAFVHDPKTPVEEFEKLGLLSEEAVMRRNAVKPPDKPPEAK